MDSYYQAFVDGIYNANPALAAASYEEQKHALIQHHFGTSDFYSTNLNAIGHAGTEVIYTCVPLQQQWAREHEVVSGKEGPPMRGSARLPWMFQFAERQRARILIEQIKDFRPDVVHFQAPVGTPRQVLEAVREVTKIVTSQVASHVPDFAAFKRYDMVLTSFPHYVERFRKAGARSEYFNLGFEPRVLNRLERGASHDVVFVGGLSPRHAARTAWLEEVASRVQLKWWGYGVEHLAANSPLRAAHQGEAWGLDMYNIFYNSRIVLNHHIDEAEDNANNMRLYEATGTGAMLLTDAKKNMGDLFAVNGEVVTYASPSECAERVEYFLGHELERAAIAKAGQERTLKSHTYRQRMERLVTLLEPLVTA